VSESGLLANLGEKVVRALPPAFLLMLILNVVFIGVTAWLYQHNVDARAILMTKIVDACLLDRHSAPP
jgi:hypothetical protein